METQPMYKTERAFLLGMTRAEAHELLDAARAGIEVSSSGITHDAAQFGAAA